MARTKIHRADPRSKITGLRQPTLFDKDTARSIRKMRKQNLLPCPVCDEPKPFTRDEEFVDETGFVCKSCGSNIYYDEDQA